MVCSNDALNNKTVAPAENPYLPDILHSSSAEVGQFITANAARPPSLHYHFIELGPSAIMNPHSPSSTVTTQSLVSTEGNPFQQAAGGGDSKGSLAYTVGIGSGDSHAGKKCCAGDELECEL